MGFSECSEALGNKVDSTIDSFFKKLGLHVFSCLKITIILTIVLDVACGSGLAVLTSKNRPEKLWVPQDTMAEQETVKYKSIYKPNYCLNNVLITSSDENNKNVLYKYILVCAMKLHKNIEDGEGEHNNFTKKRTL